MNKIKEMRNKLGYSVYKLSEITGLTPSYISNLENGNRTNPSKVAMEKIAESLGHTVTEVFFPDENPGREVS